MDTSFELSLSSFDCLCDPHVLTEGTLVSLHLHKSLNAHLLVVCLPVQFEQKEHLKNLTAVLQKDEVSWWEESSGPGDTYDSNCTKSTISSAGSFLGGLIICTEIVTCGDGY